MTTIRMPYERHRQVCDVGEFSRTKQSFKDECDVNIVVKRHATEKVNTHVNMALPVYQDVTGADDLLGAIEAVRAAELAFGEMPSGIRKAAENNPVQFLEMIHDEGGRGILEAAGLDFGNEPVVVVEEPVGAGTPDVVTPEGVGIE